MAVTPNFWVTISLYKKECLPVITQNKKHSSKQVVSMIYTLGKDVLQLLLFKVSETFLLRQSKNNSHNFVAPLITNSLIDLIKMFF